MSAALRATALVLGIAALVLAWMLYRAPAMAIMLSLSGFCR